MADERASEVAVKPITAMELLGISDEKLSQYTVRLNQSGPWLDVLDEYYSNHEGLLDHVFTRKWPQDSKVKGNVPQSKVLQFIQLSPQNKSHWLFIGAFVVKDASLRDDGREIYEREEIEQFRQYDARLVVDYHKHQGNTQVINDTSNESVHQRFLTEMIVQKVSQSPVSARPFPGFRNVRLSFAELKAVINNEEWRGALESVKAVYLQTDESTGWHYVGSAYGRKGSELGLLARWSEYAGDDHTGGNKQLKRLVQDKGSEYIEQNFHYSILDIFDMATPDKEVIEREHWWMAVLDSVYDQDSDHPHGYNTKLQWGNTARGEEAGRE